jgi:hypothetical protein
MCAEEFSLREGHGEDGEALFEAYRLTALVAYEHIYPPDWYPLPDDAVRGD